MTSSTRANVTNSILREDFSKIKTIIPIPHLIVIQLKSFHNFLQLESDPLQRENKGLEEIFRSVFPIVDSNKCVSLEFVGYEIGNWFCGCGEYKSLGGGEKQCQICKKKILRKEKYDHLECLRKGFTYADPLKILVRLIVSEKDDRTNELTVRDVKEQKIYLGEIPLMTKKGTFVINGVERVVVSQMHRSPGVFFAHDKGKGSIRGNILYSARIIPYRGSWINFEFDAKDILYVRIDRRRKLHATIFLKALGFSTEELLTTFYNSEKVSFSPADLSFSLPLTDILLGFHPKDDIVNPASGEPIVRSLRKITKNNLRKIKKLSKIDHVVIPHEELIGKIIARDIVDEATGEVLYEINSEITSDTIDTIKSKNIKEFYLLQIDDIKADASFRNTLAIDKTNTQEEAMRELYKRLRPGDPPTKEVANTLIENMFFNSKRYDLSDVGRIKINEKLGLDISIDVRTLTREDIIAVVKYLFHLKMGIGSTDDIDQLSNRRVRSVGESLGNNLRLGLVRMERAIFERMSIQDIDVAMPYELINSKPVTAAIKEFFGSSQLSQFMDQTNPLSEITHKRRLSALGPGGLTRERAQFEVRDVHPTHYGRICPVETPEGPNIGLIASLSTYAQVNKYGFMETPYRKVENGKVSNHIDVLNAVTEGKYIIAQANAPIDEKGYFTNELISSRKGGEFHMAAADKVNYMDVSPKQLVSVAASLIPFLENDDANRALMGSNMQRQAVPLLFTEAPLVGTGMEKKVAEDSGAVVLSEEDGKVISSDAQRIIIKAKDSPSIRVYNLVKYQRSNQNTCINQFPIVTPGQIVKKGDTIADGPATDRGDLALGRNLLVAFMPWGGYNFEDAIIINEKLVKKDGFTSIHIEVFDVEARDTKQGKEEITRDIPNVGEDALKYLDESGIVHIGAKVNPDDILVGKITPKGETQLSPEEKLLKAIFGEKAEEVRDTSLRVPPGIEGTVIDVKVFSRKSVEKDSRSLKIEELEINEVEREYIDILKVLKDERDNEIRSLYKGKSVTKAFSHPKKKNVSIKKGEKLTDDLLDKIEVRFLNTLKIDGDTSLIKKVEEATKEQTDELKRKLEEKIEKIKQHDEMPPGVIKIVKIFICMKRKLSVGDKMAGRHGNKGVVSIIVPEEDMPYLPDGTTVDIILNPLGVPSRMNVGQILETYLGLAANKLNKFFATPVFDGIPESKIRDLLHEAGCNGTASTKLFDGKTGEPFDLPVIVGYIYMLKLHHLVDDKIHARSTGSYSLVTQQPLGGKAQFGGQRLGEMEVWALEAYGAAFTLQEMLTVKSDDVEGRKRMYESIVKGGTTLRPSLPESFNVLVKELQSLALDVELAEDE